MGEPKWQPRCVARTGKECRDCCECLAKHPEGKTCATCVHAVRCNLIFGLKSPETQYFCDWIPSRYTPEKAAFVASSDPSEETRNG